MSKFKIVAMGRVGTLAISRFTNEHPEVELASYNETTKVFKATTGNLGNLLAEQPNQPHCRGITIHDSDFFDKQYRKKLTQLNNIKTDALIHVVRNPIEQAKSWINHINASSFISMYKWKRIKPTAEGFFTAYPNHFQTMMSGFQCRTFYKNCKNIKAIDFTSLLSPDIEQTMQEVYQFLRIDHAFKTPLLHDTQNSYTRQILLEGIAFELNGEAIDMGMVPVDLYFYNEPNITPWITVHDTESIFAQCPSLPPLKGDLVLLPKSFAALNKLSYKTRKMLQEGIRDIVSEIMPVWAQKAENIAQQIERSKINQLTDEDHRFIKDKVSEDLDVFYRYHPQFKSLWSF